MIGALLRDAEQIGLDGNLSFSPCAAHRVHLTEALVLRLAELFHLASSF